jgi:hypothetical protein
MSPFTSIYRGVDTLGEHLGGMIALGEWLSSLLHVGRSMIWGFKAVTQWITPKTASRKSPGVDMWKLARMGPG